MFNSYNDAQLMNESYVFYTTSTNTFKNPAFAALDGEEESCYDFARKGQLIREQRPQHGADSATPKEAARHADLSTTTTTTTTTNQRMIDFCDNIAFTVRAKMFIMETNLKRKFRGLQRFLNKQVLVRRWWCSSPSSRPSSHRSAGHDQMSASSSLRDLINNERSSQGGRRFSSSEPISAKALGFQQERILTRLESIKRDSQRLFNLHHATIIESNNETASEATVADFSSQDSAEAAQSNRFQVPVWLASSEAESQATGGGDDDDDSQQPPEATHYPNRPRSAQVGRCPRWAAISRGNKQLKQVAAAYSLSNPKKTCIVCYERTPNIVTLPCEHSDICSDCFIEIIYMAVKNSQYPLRCVLCRQKVERIRCSRRLMLSVIKRNRKSSSTTGASNGGSWTKSSKISCRLPF